MTAEGERQYVSDMLIALTRATPEQAFLLRAHVGNYSLFLSGIFHENTQHRSLRGAPDLAFYEQVGRTNYQLVASHATARRCDLSDVYEGLAGRFHEVRLALNRLSDSLLNLTRAAQSVTHNVSSPPFLAFGLRTHSSSEPGGRMPWDQPGRLFDRSGPLRAVVAAGGGERTRAAELARILRRADDQLYVGIYIRAG
jgi:hypothetical protein